MDGIWAKLAPWLLLLAGILAACGSAAPKNAGPAEAPTPTVTAPIPLPVIISIGGRFAGAELALLDEQIAAFEAENPDIKVELVNIPGDVQERRDQVAAYLQAGDNGFDIFVINDTWLAELAAGGGLQPLAGLADTGGFLPAAVQASTIEGRVMSLPWTVDGGLLYYRRDLLATYGYAPPASWSEVAHIAAEIRSGEGLAGGYVWQGAAYETLTCNTLEFIWAEGGTVLERGDPTLFDSPRSRAALQQMVGLIDSGASSPAVTTYFEGQALAAFQAGDAALMRHWSSAWTALNSPNSPLAGRVGLAPLPAACYFGQSLVLSHASLHPEQARQFMAFLVDYEQQVQLARQTDQRPALQAAYHDAELLAAKPHLAQIYAALAQSRPRPQVTAYPETSAAIYDNVHRLLTGEQDVATTATQIETSLQAILQEQD